MLNTSTPNTVTGSLAPGYSEPLSASAHIGLVNAWRAFRYDPASPTDLTNLYAFQNNQGPSTYTGAEGKGYNDSPFALVIPQGVGTGERIGRDVSVMSDSWYFRWTFPRLIPGDDAQVTMTPGNLNHQRFVPLACLGSLTPGNRDRVFADGLPHLSYNLSQRPIRVRMVCIFEPNCQTPGDFGFSTSELFESLYDIHSRFSVDQASGYKIVFDETRTCTLMDNLGRATNGYNEAADQDDKASAGPYEIHFKCRLPPYLRRYEARNSPDETNGYEVLVTGSEVLGGVAKGALTWYFFIEDIYCPTFVNVAAPGTPATGPRYQAPEIVNLEIDRKTKWIDP